MSSDRLATRLEALPKAALIELAAAGCATNQTLRNRADALIASHRSLPDWCVQEILLAPDLLQAIMANMPLAKAIAPTCATWAAAWSVCTARRRCVHPVRSFHVPSAVPVLAAATMLPSGAYVACGDVDTGLVEMTAITRMPDGRFVACGEEDTPPVDMGHALDSWRIHHVDAHASDINLLLVDDGTAVVTSCTGYELGDVLQGSYVRKIQISTGWEVARSTYIAAPDGIAIAGERLYVAASDTVRILDADTLEDRGAFGQFTEATGCAVSGTRVYVADVGRRGQLQVFNLQGMRSHTIEGNFGHPAALVAHEERLYILETEPDENDPPTTYKPHIGGADEGSRLIVLDLDGGILQTLRLPEAKNLVSLSRMGNDLLVADGPGLSVFVLRILGVNA